MHIKKGEQDFKASMKTLAKALRTGEAKLVNPLL